MFPRDFERRPMNEPDRFPMSPGAEAIMTRRQRWQARKNPPMAKPIRYDDPKGGYQQPGVATGEVMQNASGPSTVDPRTGSVREQTMFPGGLNRENAEVRKPGSIMDAIRDIRSQNGGAAAILARRRQQGRVD